MPHYFERPLSYDNMDWSRVQSMESSVSPVGPDRLRPTRNPTSPYPRMRGEPLSPSRPATTPQGPHTDVNLGAEPVIPPVIAPISKKIPKPPGEVGRPGRGGYTLQKTLGWNNEVYRDVKNYINKLCMDHLDGKLPLNEQALNNAKRVREQARVKFPFLSDYDKEWVTDDFIRSHLKYRRVSLANQALKSEAQINLRARGLRSHDGDTSQASRD
ncbi:hypothetical protein K435DRAFT_800519 [Dendrothele bispora CBS 962.96]|uniref:Uncharacterized protein n=1 Tax=Dendrothele bispora (strain CBS 962.96) TaxID=1314807 RepID=A0A4S8LTN4_DENBC|nr:hypothetical protein K435DRAFT_800505 [Dendrothele bispora CBS 962.96]THU92413.1 hypothetical protein K435DRAFT_800519 [Dendrothele bispora CBS 962.96]